MRIHFGGIVKSIAFLLILSNVLLATNRVLMPKSIIANNRWPTTSTYHQFYNMKHDSVDVLFLGSSVTVNAFSPQEIYNHFGIRSYNLGSEQQSIFLSYFWLKEALRFQTPQVVILDTKFLFELHKENPINTTEGLIRKCLDPMRWSCVKQEAVKELCAIDKDQTELSYYFTNIRYHSRWSDLKEYDMVSSETKNSELKGYAAIETYGSETYAAFISSGDTEIKAETHKIMQIYLDKIVELCQNNDITLILVSLPGNSMSDAINNTLTSYAQINDIDYYNMCEVELYNSVGAVLPKENTIGHENIWGAMKMSQFFGKMLRDNYGLPSTVDMQYEETKEFYDHIIKNCELNHITNICEYLKAINDKHYTTFIVIRDEATAHLIDDAVAGLKELGLQSDLTGKYGWSYCAVISPENGISEVLSQNAPAELAGSIRNKKTFYTVSSCGFLSGITSTITIDGKEYCPNVRGLNFVIYDNDLMKVIDQVTFDTCGNNIAIR